MRRVLALIREESEDTSDSESGDGANNSLLITSMFSLLQTDFDNGNSSDNSKGAKKDLKPYIIEGIQELIDELRNSSESIAGKSVEMIHEK